MTAALSLLPSPGAQAALALAEALSARVALTERLAASLAGGDQAQVRALAEAAQEASRAVNRAGERLSEIDFSTPSGAQMRQLLGQLASRATESDGRLRAAIASSGFAGLGDWLAARARGPELLGSLLADPWSLKHDLIVLLGEGAPSLVGSLRERGQERIFCEMKPGEAVEGACAIARLDELDPASWRLGLPLPGRFRVHVAGRSALGEAPVIARLQEALPTVSDFGRALEVLAPRFLRHSARNLASIAEHPSAHRLAGRFQGLPAVVVAAGPSLDKNVHLLRELKGHAVIIAINQTVKALRRAGVQPDLVLACDYQSLAYQFEGVQPGEIPALGLGASVDPELFRVPAGQIFTVATSPIVESWIYGLLGEDASAAAGGTVSITALHLAFKMGCSPIVAVGLDLALAGQKYYADHAADGGRPLTVGEDGRSLSMSTFDSKLRLALQDDERRQLRAALDKKLELVEVPGWSGAPVKTTYNMQRQLLALRAHLAERRGQAELVNATEGGAFIEGMDHRPLCEIVERCRALPVDAPRILREALGETDLGARRSQMGTRLVALREDLGRAIVLARRCLKSMRGHRGADPRAAARLQTCARRLPFLTVMLSAQLCEVARTASEKESTLARLDSAEAALYRTIESEGTTLVPLLERAIAQLHRGGA